MKSLVRALATGVAGAVLLGALPLLAWQSTSASQVQDNPARSSASQSGANQSSAPQASTTQNGTTQTTSQSTGQTTTGQSFGNVLHTRR